MSREVVITGRGVVASVGEGADAFFDALTARRSGIADGVGRVRGVRPRGRMTPKEARRTDRFAQFAVAAAAQAAEEAGLPDGIEPERLGVLMGTGMGGLEHARARVPQRGWSAATARSRRTSSR